VTTASPQAVGVVARPQRSDVVYSLRGVGRVYRTGEVEVHALRSVDLDVRDGELMVLLGPSGSGKSTLLNLLGGLDNATSGTLFYRALDLSNAGESKLTQYRRNCVGFVFQFYNLIPSLSARENVALVTEIALQPMPPEEALDLVGLTEQIDYFPSQMSGGQQQRVAIARAIAKRPDVLLCDEPTGALDIATGKLVLEALARVNRQLGTTTIIITHNASIARMADRVLHVVDGCIARTETNARRAAVEEIDW